VVLAVPVGPPDAGIRFAGEVDDYICPSEPVGFFAVGAYYDDFAQVSDAEVRALLGQAPDDGCDPSSPLAPPRVRGGVDWTQITHREVAIPASPDILLHGDLRLPPTPEGLIVFAHGSGSSRLSPRNIQVAGALCADGFATLLFDLLDDREAADRRKEFDIQLLTERLLAATTWARRQEELSGLPVGYFGASTGAAAALCAAADPHSGVAAVVCRGGRPDLAAERLAEVAAPTLLIGGGADTAVLELNRQAQLSLRCPSTLLIVPGAGHVFEEPGALEQVADEASRWFCDRLARRRAASKEGRP
ncbi:MAG: dienelactone hydrolase family protein, partial [Thermoleophilaceae bacterium]